MTAIALNEIHINFGFNTVLDGASFEIMEGEKAALVGSNGTGKTTLLNIIAGLETYDSGLVTVRRNATLGYLEQQSDINGEDITVMDYLWEGQTEIRETERAMRALEERMGLLDGNRLNKALAEYDRLQNRFMALDGYAAEEHFNKICNVFKLDDSRLMQPCGVLSGGQKTVVKLAHVLLCKPDILLLDEPTNHIDIEAMRWLEDFIRAYPGTVLIVSHDRYFIDKTVTKTILLEDGRATVFGGNYSYAQKEQERLLMLQFDQYKNQQRQIEAMRDAIKRFREWGARGNNKRMFKRADNMEKRLEKMTLLNKPQTEREKLPLKFESGKRSGKRVLTMRALGFAYGEETMLRGIDMDVFYRDRLCLMGANGSGKTTLLKLIMGHLTIGNGTLVMGESVRVGYIEQETRFENEQDTIVEALKKDATVHENDARRILARYYFFGDAVYKRLDKLSGGERVIVKLAMLMQKSVNLLVLDEPTNHLDIDTREMLEEALMDYKGTLLFVSHDRYFVNKIAKRVAYLENGALSVYEGNYDDFMHSVFK